MSDNEAVKLIETAEAIADGFCMPWNRYRKYEKSAEIFTSASNIYVANGNWDIAGLTYLKAIKMYRKADSNSTEIHTLYVNVVNCFRKSDNPEYVKYARDVIDMHIIKGRFSVAAKLEEELAKYFEEKSDLKNSALCYNKVISYCDSYSGYSITKSRMEIELARLYVLMGNYNQSINIYDRASTESLLNLRFKYPEYCQQALLCILAQGDIVRAKTALEKYKDLDIKFERTGECRLCEGIIKAVEEKDVCEFERVLRAYNNITPFTDLQVIICTKIKESLNDVL